MNAPDLFPFFLDALPERGREVLKKIRHMWTKPQLCLEVVRFLERVIRADKINSSRRSLPVTSSWPSPGDTDRTQSLLSSSSHTSTTCISHGNDNSLIPPTFLSHHDSIMPFSWAGRSPSPSFHSEALLSPAEQILSTLNTKEDALRLLLELYDVNHETKDPAIDKWRALLTELKRPINNKLSKSASRLSALSRMDSTTDANGSAFKRPALRERRTPVSSVVEDLEWSTLGVVSSLTIEDMKFGDVHVKNEVFYTTFIFTLTMHQPLWGFAPTHKTAIVYGALEFSSDKPISMGGKLVQSTFFWDVEDFLNQLGLLKSKPLIPVQRGGPSEEEHLHSQAESSTLASSSLASCSNPSPAASSSVSSSISHLINSDAPNPLHAFPVLSSPSSSTSIASSSTPSSQSQSSPFGNFSLNFGPAGIRVNDLVSSFAPPSAPASPFIAPKTEGSGFVPPFMPPPKGSHQQRQMERMYKTHQNHMRRIDMQIQQVLGTPTNIPTRPSGSSNPPPAPPRVDYTSLPPSPGMSPQFAQPSPLPGPSASPGTMAFSSLGNSPVMARRNSAYVSSPSQRTRSVIQKQRKMQLMFRPIKDRE